ncbi:hypothetical protein [Shinella sp. M31]|uniref:hypothetical protein n=1 Tax=Shinella sp. M31 TaxID=3368615 RepID=UPI003BA04CDB
MNGLNFPANGESANSFGNRLVVTTATAEHFGAGFGNDTILDETTSTSISARPGAGRPESPPVIITE